MPSSRHRWEGTKSGGVDDRVQPNAAELGALPAKPEAPMASRHYRWLIAHEKDGTVADRGIAAPIKNWQTALVPMTRHDTAGRSSRRTLHKRQQARA